MKDDLRSAICLVVRHRCDIISLRCLVGPPYIVTFPPHHAICHLDLAVESIRRFLQLVNASENMDAIGVGVFSALETVTLTFHGFFVLMSVKSFLTVQIAQDR